MNKQQKIAWYNIIVIAVVSVITAAAIAILYSKYGFPKALAGLGLLGFMGLLGLTSLLFRQKKGKMNFDERDTLIHYRSSVIAYAAFFPVFTVACMVPWFVFGSKTSVSLSILPIMLGFFGIFLVLVQSIAILILYGRETQNNEEKLS